MSSSLATLNEPIVDLESRKKLIAPDGKVISFSPASIFKTNDMSPLSFDIDIIDDDTLTGNDGVKVDKLNDANTLNKISNNYDLMNGSDQFLRAVAEATEHLGLKNNTLIDTIKNIIQGRFEISLVTKQPVAGEGNARREHTLHSDISKKPHNSQTESHVTDYSTALTALERSNVHFSAIENGTLAIPAFQAGDLARLSSTTEQSSQVKTPVKIEIRTYTRKEDDLKNPKIAAAVKKLLAYQGQIEYQRARGGAALPLEQWLDVTFIQSKKLEKEELEVIPMWAYQQFDHRLAKAFHNKKHQN